MLNVEDPPMDRKVDEIPSPPEAVKHDATYLSIARGMLLPCCPIPFVCLYSLAPSIVLSREADATMQATQLVFHATLLTLASVYHNREPVVGRNWGHFSALCQFFFAFPALALNGITPWSVSFTVLSLLSALTFARSFEKSWWQLPPLICIAVQVYAAPEMPFHLAIVFVAHLCFLTMLITPKSDPERIDKNSALVAGLFFLVFIRGTNLICSLIILFCMIWWTAVDVIKDEDTLEGVKIADLRRPLSLWGVDIEQRRPIVVVISAYFLILTAQICLQRPGILHGMTLTMHSAAIFVFSTDMIWIPEQWTKLRLMYLVIAWPAGVVIGCFEGRLGALRIIVCVLGWISFYRVKEIKAATAEERVEDCEPIDEATVKHRIKLSRRLLLFLYAPSFLLVAAALALYKEDEVLHFMFHFGIILPAFAADATEPIHFYPFSPAVTAVFCLNAALTIPITALSSDNGEDPVILFTCVLFAIALTALGSSVYAVQSSLPFHHASIATKLNSPKEDDKQLLL